MSCTEAGRKRKVFKSKARSLEAVTWGKNCQQLKIRSEKMS